MNIFRRKTFLFVLFLLLFLGGAYILIQRVPGVLSTKAQKFLLKKGCTSAEFNLSFSSWNQIHARPFRAECPAGNQKILIHLESLHLTLSRSDFSQRKLSALSARNGTVEILSSHNQKSKTLQKKPFHFPEFPVQHLEVENIRVQHPQLLQYNFIPEVTATIDAVQDDIFGKITAVDQNGNSFPSQGRISRKVNGVAFDLQLSPIHFQEDRPLSSLFKWPYPVEIIKGSLSLNVHFFQSIVGKDSSKIDLGLNDISGSASGVNFQKINATLQLQPFPGITTLKPVSITATQIEKGLLVKDFSGILELLPDTKSKNTHLILSNIKADFLNGEISSKEGLRFDFQNQKGAVDITFQGIGLQQLAALEKQKNIEATGVLDGSLPVRFDPSGVSVEQGTAAARPPGGVIRYNKPFAGESGALSAQLKLVEDALKNYQYNHLEAKMNYQKDGTLLISTVFKGKNPDMNNGQPINVNLNIEENIPALVRSLQLSKSVQRQVEENIGKIR